MYRGGLQRHLGHILSPRRELPTIYVLSSDGFRIGILHDYIRLSLLLDKFHAERTAYGRVKPEAILLSPTSQLARGVGPSLSHLG